MHELEKVDSRSSGFSTTHSKIPRDFPGRPTRRTFAKPTRRPSHRAGTRGTTDGTATISAQPTGTRGIAAAVGLPPDERFYPPKHIYAAPIMFTPKKDGGFRMCIDYRALNRITIKSRYHQIRVAAEDCHKTAFRTRYGSYEYLVMPFGLTNAPSTFQMTMNGAFRELLDKCVIIYLDDILIYSRSREQHLKDLDAVFTLLHKNRLITKGSKCDFLKQELEFLGHVVSTEGVKIDPRKIKTIQEWKPPTNLKELQSFLGFVNYVRCFIPNMAGLSAPLTDRLKDHDCFWWGEKQQAAFDQLKIALTSPPVLRISDPNRPYEVVTDASDIAIGAVLLQDFDDGLQPVAYESRKLQGAEKNYTVHDKEMLAIVHAFKTWRCYLTGADVTVRMDHKSLQYLRAQPNLNPRQIRWLDFLESNFHYTITYKWGANNIVDALTRPTVHTAAILHTTATGPYFHKRGTSRIWVPGYDLLRTLLIQESHDNPTSGHFGVDKTTKMLQRNYYWPNMADDVRKYVSSCTACQIMKSSHQRAAGLLQPLDPPERPWQHDTMDYVTGLPTGPSGNDAILVVTITAEQTAQLFIANIIRLHGLPSAIISDQDPKFTSNFWRHLWDQFGTKLQFSSAYHPQTDGQTERVNQTMEQLIRTTCTDPSTWEKSLPLLEFAYNNATLATTNQSPFFLNYGQDPVVPSTPNID
ncbi:hypothetical protein CLOM_g4567 [Closterium sp. NIES-68]|nr:hypothetical protein CLOM_g4567 [Closterium sp. NIES-68]